MKFLLLLHFFLLPEVLCESPQKIRLENSYGASLDEFSTELARNRLASLRKGHGNLKNWLHRRSYLRKKVVSELGADFTRPVTRPAPFISRTLLRTGYKIQNLAFRTPEGQILTGNLYSPLTDGKKPGILSPPDHADVGRFDPDLQIRCATLARMGALVFTWDMLGWGESLGEHENNEAKGTQLRNSLAALDFLLSLEDVDPARIGFCASSGGAIQGLLLNAVDERIHATALVSMISSLSMGHCACETQGFHYREEDFFTDNSELSALSAPRPLLLISNGEDWTRKFPELGAQLVEDVYKLYSSSATFESVHLAGEGHDFGVTKRRLVYNFFQKHLNLKSTIDQGQETGVDVETLRILPKQTLKVFENQDLRYQYFGAESH
ncbi:hypothetical protein HOF92_00990 [bacterium]|nr:hypothetical protein [bacterium]